MLYWVRDNENNPCIGVKGNICVQCRRWTFENPYPYPIWPWPTSRGYCSMYRRKLPSNYTCALFVPKPV